MSCSDQVGPPAAGRRAWTPVTRLERHLVVAVAAALRGIGHRRGNRRLPAPHELHALGHDLDHVPLLAVLGLPVPGLKPSLDHHRAAFVEVFAARLGLLPPNDDGEETRLVALFTGL